MEIRDKTVLITGASMGIGRATAELFAAKGAKVALAARSVDKLKELAAKLPNSFVVPADMSKPEDVRRMVRDTHAHYGRIDVLINNAGQGMISAVEHIDLADYAALMSLNLYGPLIAMQAVIPIMREQHAGAIVNISSGLSRMTLPNVAAYAATKSALNMLSLTARAELADDGIAVSVVYPGVTATAFRENAMRSKAASARPAFRRDLPQADSVECVAARILEAVETGVAEVIIAPRYTPASR